MEPSTILWNPICRTATDPMMPRQQTRDRRRRKARKPTRRRNTINSNNSLKRPRSSRPRQGRFSRCPHNHYGRPSMSWFKSDSITICRTLLPRKPRKASYPNLCARGWGTWRRWGPSAWKLVCKSLQGTTASLNRSPSRGVTCWKSIPLSSTWIPG